MENKELVQPRRKRVRRNLILSQPFPIPISSYTGIPAANTSWRWYDGVIVGQFVEVEDPDSVKMISTMGFFGELHTKGEEKESLVALEDFDPSRYLSCVKDIDQSEISSDGESDSGVRHSRRKEEPETLLLADYEAMFLAKGLGCLRVTLQGEKDPLTIDQLWSHFSNLSDDFPLRYAVYHHFRSKNWVVKDARKYGNDFLLYKDGPPFFHASYSVRIERIGKAPSLSWSMLAALNRVTESAAKEVLIAQVLESPSKTSIDVYLKSTVISELLVKRWIPSQKREAEK